MVFQQGPIPGSGTDRPPVSFITDNTCGEVMLCVPASVSAEALRGIAQRFCDIDTRAVNVVYYASLNQYRIFHPDTPLANQLGGYDFLYAARPKERSHPDPDAMPSDVDDGNDTEHVPRPRNKWILYRQEKSRQILPENPRLSAGDISKIVADMWKNESEEVKAYWTQMAKEEELQHKEKHPDYQFTTNKVVGGPKKRKSSVSHSPGCSPPGKTAKYDTDEL